jgi:hypothetical protein
MNKEEEPAFKLLEYFRNMVEIEYMKIDTGLPIHKSSWIEGFCVGYTKAKKEQIT